MECLRSLAQLLPRAVGLPRRTLCALALGLTSGTRPVVAYGRVTELLGRRRAAPLCWPRRLPVTGEIYRNRTSDVSQATLASVSPVFTVYLKAVITPECLLILDYRNLNLEQWLFRELPSQLAGEGQLVTYPLPFEFRAIEALLQYRINTLQGKLSILQPLILETLDALVDPKHSSIDRSKLHILLQNGKSLSELETDIKIFKESILEILDEEELLEELCLTKWSDPRVFEKSSAGIDHAEEMELLLENYYRLAEDLSNAARELRALIDDSQSIIFINLDSHRNVMMRLNLQLTMGTFSLSLFGLMGVAFGMNLESSLEEDHRVFWLITGIMFMGSGLIWRRLLSFLGRQLEAPLPPLMASLPKKTLQADRRLEMKHSFRPDGLGSSRGILTNR
ncbi:magnesium transporter MRS2 homolog, mitochondrial isoform X3 [Capricornis sumatraensis]|uniref:magnesium transporter MRS2 homolog, mitochondrial isoform X3 n=1 Tax=Capricornis sumatraensis TaxID=34865 RepID=UPI0036046184